ncbi:MAG: hypothetical protein ACRCYQ_01020 [Nocardioides sp.]
MVRLPRRGARAPEAPALRGVLTMVAGLLLVSGCEIDRPRQVPAAPPPVPPTTLEGGSARPEPPPGLATPVPGRRERRVDWRFVEEVPGPALILELQAGGPPCDAVTDVTAVESSSAVDIAVWAGRTPGARCAGVPALLGTFRIRVPLTAPLGSREVRAG